MVTGLSSTARVITSAALIMISVFASFVLGDDPTGKLFGVGLAVAVFLDATLVRMVLVPATMSLARRAPTGGCRVGSTGSSRTSTSRAAHTGGAAVVAPAAPERELVGVSV